MYSEVSVERMNPTYGPFFGDEVCLFTKGRFLVDDIIIQVAHNEQTVPIQEFNKYVNYIIFRMPQMQATGHINTKVQVNVYYKNNLISTMPYVYSSSIDGKQSSHRAIYSNASIRISFIDFRNFRFDEFE